MADRRASQDQDNVLRHIISTQLEKTPSKQKPYAPAEETKPGNGLKSLFSKLLRQKRQEGIVIADQKISATQEEQLNQNQSLENHLEFKEFEHFGKENTANQDLSALTVAQNKKQDIPQELQEGFNGVNQFEGQINAKGIVQEPQEAISEVNQFVIEDNIGQELQESVSEVEQFEGQIEDSIGQELQEGVSELKQFDGVIIETEGQELQEVVNEVEQFEGVIIETEGQELQKGVNEVEHFDGVIIEDKGKEELQKGVFNGVIEDMSEGTKGLQKEVKGAKQFKGEIKDALDFEKVDSKNPKENPVLKNISNKRKSEEISTELPKTSVSVLTDDDGKITGLNLFLGAQPTKKARKRGYSPSGKKQLLAKATKLKKQARSVSDRKEKVINMSR